MLARSNHYGDFREASPREAFFFINPKILQNKTNFADKTDINCAYWKEQP
jgi:hypothetical protein